MKTIILVLLVVSVIFIVFQSFMVISTKNTEEQNYSVILKEKDFEKNLPKPNDPNVKLERTKEEYVAVFQFGGFVSDKDLKYYTEELQSKLNEKGITSYGSFRFLGYNPPYQLIGRRNEIIVSVDWQKE